MDIEKFLAAKLAEPLTHRVVTTYASGITKTHETRSLAQAQNFAVGQLRKVGRRLIDRDTGATVVVTAVEIEAI